MDAPRLPRLWGIKLFLICSLLGLACASSAQAASARSQNFIVSAATQELANEVARSAEKYRHDLAIEWLGHELPNWDQPCPITVRVSPRMGAGGATSFMFGNGKPYGWTMDIFGPEERVLDSVLPHEVTHTIFATHFGRPLPRWADEGACTTVEHASERGKQEKLLYQFLTTNRGIAFNKMFAMTEYPRDILPLYSQGYALARYLIALEGKQTFVKYVGEGMDTRNWTAATKKYYGFHSLSDLQLSWLDWVRKKTPQISDANDVLYVSTNASLNGRTLADVMGKAAPAAAAIARNDLPRTEPANGERAAARTFTPINTNTSTAKPSANTGASKRPPANQLPHELRDATSLAAYNASQVEPEQRPSGDGWYARRRDQARARENPSVAMQPTVERERTAENNHFTSASRPQEPQQVRQTILEWKKDQRSLAPVGE
jgi:hypothetical protein